MVGRAPTLTGALGASIQAYVPRSKYLILCSSTPAVMSLMQLRCGVCKPFMLA
jgi:hypothetical protein